MKWMTLGIAVLFLSACGTTTKVVEYRQVTVTPVVKKVTLIEQEPVDVTTTTVKCCPGCCY